MAVLAALGEVRMVSLGVFGKKGKGGGRFFMFLHMRNFKMVDE